jgi:hypothetical protein
VTAVKRSNHKKRIQQQMMYGGAGQAQPGYPPR